jgi:uncharacterized protein YbaA (DUF1428 family)
MYADGFVFPIPRRNLRAYGRIARKAGRIWREHGAIDYKECVGEDLQVKCGARFPKLVRARRGETVGFSWVVFKSRAHRDRVNKVMKDPRLATMMDRRLPFDIGGCPTAASRSGRRSRRPR